MADTPAPSRKKAFDIAHPGAKEYGIVIAGALGTFLLVDWIKNRGSSATSDTGTKTGTGSNIVSGAYGPGAAAIWLAFRDLQSSTKTTTTTTSSGGKSTAGKVRVPDVTGDQLDVAYATLAAAGLRADTRMKGPEPAHSEHKVISESDPKAGTRVDRGTQVHLTAEAASHVGAAPKKAPARHTKVRK